MGNVTVVLPTYNEAENLPALVADLLALVDESGRSVQILVVDDASPDGTGRVADELAVRYPDRVHTMHRAGKMGLGTAYIEGFTWAIEHGADDIVQMDADFSHSPSYVSDMLDLIKSYDVVVGSRYVAGGELDRRWGLGRRALSAWANSVWTRLLLGVQTRDATAGFKCWRRCALELIDLSKVRSNGYVFQVEMCYAAEKLGLRIKEMPIYFEDRRAGQSKMSTRIKIEAALRVLEIRWRYRTRTAAQPAEALAGKQP